MIVLDTSAILAILLNEPTKSICMDAIARADRISISAGTVAELLLVAGQRRFRDVAERFLSENAIEVRSVTPDGAQRVADAHQRWGKGVHPAGLNFGDCFAYALAQEEGCPLLFVGNDFARTDIVSALA